MIAYNPIVVVVLMVSFIAPERLIKLFYDTRIPKIDLDNSDQARVYTRV